MTRVFQMALFVVIAITTLNNAAGVTFWVAPQQEPIAGGYADKANDDPEVLAAVRFAIRKESQKLHTRISLIAIKRAEVQVVAGLNNRVCMTLKIKRKRRSVTVVVYQNLKQQYSLTSWTEGVCLAK